MSYNEYLADRIRIVLEKKSILFEEKKMFGGLCILVDDKMCLGVIKDDLMVRVGEEAELAHEHEEGVRPMDFTKKRMKGYLYVNQMALDNEDDLENWVQHCLDFNPDAKSSKRKEKK
jgi:TfoX/Sxy family transcriptional regulator of competence genes